MTTYRLAVIGDQCGKTSIVNRFVNQLFIVIHSPTQEDVQYTSVTLDGEVCDLSILDTAGENLWKHLYEQPGFLRPWIDAVDGVMLLFNPHNQYSFDVAPIAYIEILKIRRGTPAVFVATQIDKENRVVSTEAGKNLGLKYNIPYLEASARTGEGVSEAFAACIREIRKTRAPPPPQLAPPPPLSTPPPSLNTPPMANSHRASLSLAASPILSHRDSNANGAKKPAAAVPVVGLKKEKPREIGPSKAGPLLKLGGGMRKVMQKRFFAIKDGNLHFYRSKAGYEEDNSHKTISLLTTTVKPSKIPKSFDLVTLTKTFTFQAETTEDLTEWISAIKDSIMALLNNQMASRNAPAPPLTSTSTQSSATHSNPSQTLLNSFNSFSAVHPTPAPTNVPDGIDPREALWHEMMGCSRGNALCCECDSRSPDWTSINLGILICIQCSGVHRSLGVHISKVRSLILDKLDEDIVQYIQAVGNMKSNKIWEANIPADRKKPEPTDDRLIKEEWIKDKYVARAFLNRSSVSELSKHELDEKLYETILLNRFEACLKLVALGAAVNSTAKGHTPLHAACGLGRSLLVVLLILHGADINAVDSLGRTPLDYASAYEGSQIEHPAVVTLSSPEVILRKRGAVETGAPVNLELLSSQGALTPDPSSPPSPSSMPSESSHKPHGSNLSIGTGYHVGVRPTNQPTSAGAAHVSSSRDGVGQMDGQTLIAMKPTVIEIKEYMIPPASASKPYLAFVVNIEDPQGGRSLLKKIKQFDELNKQIQEAFPKLSPKYPKTRLGNFRDIKAVVAVQKQLQEYCNELCTKPLLLMFPPYKKFSTSDVSRHFTMTMRRAKSGKHHPVKD